MIVPELFWIFENQNDCGIGETQLKLLRSKYYSKTPSTPCIAFIFQNFELHIWISKRIRKEKNQRH